ncbi:hydrolase [Burkholderia sp. WAC0059]|uniref:hydrolase n=1 Tax=Burkholderia sp. WAC0059 TaxID=2066022 RepID=UPI000C7F7265|nr:hydrolase [Burkholderia sp. WAC0059]PLZ03566.1 hydrolase [Burkholderia sp. WAC0059]
MFNPTLFPARSKADDPAGRFPALERVGAGQLVSTDIFDTLLLRRPVSARRRQRRIAAVFAARAGAQFGHLTAGQVLRARVEAERTAYRALDLSGRSGEVRFDDIVERQLWLLGLPQQCAPQLVEAELAVEQALLKPNRALIRTLDRLRERGARIVGISDTGLSVDQLTALIVRVAGRPVVDRLYTSADLQQTKRRGDLFAAVAAEERFAFGAWTHVGDDRHADVGVPGGLGMTCIHRPRRMGYVGLRRLDGVLFEAARRCRPGALRERARHKRLAPPARFAHDVLGPIVAEFCMRLWLHLRPAAGDDATAVAFCARGGLNLHVAFKTFLASTGLSLDLKRCDLMVSRVVAARAAILAGSPAAADELAREFASATMADVARAVSGAACEWPGLGGEGEDDCGGNGEAVSGDAIEGAFDAQWSAPFEPWAFFRLLTSSRAGQCIVRRLKEQDALFMRHLAQSTGGAQRIVLCDTGLYGSMQRLLAAGHPEYDWVCLMFARCNYKGFAAPHFARTAGLSVERDGYRPFDPRSAVLRHWQLIESLFEPSLPSVRLFRRQPDGQIVSNLERPGWRTTLDACQDDALSQVFAYLQALRPTGWFGRLDADIDVAWHRLSRMLIFPDGATARVWQTGQRSRDFGRDEVVGQTVGLVPRGFVQKLRYVRGAWWKEGALALAFPAAGWTLQRAMELAYWARAAGRAVRAKRRR